VAAVPPPTVTVTISSGTAGFTTTPTGTAQFLVDGTVVSTSAVALTSGAATFSYTIPTTLASGGHTISASYSGDSNYAGSKGSLNFDVVSASAADFSLTPANTTATTTPGGTTTGVVYTVTPVNGFTGVVTFSSSVASGSTSPSATYSFTPTSVTITGTTAQTTTYSLVASETDGGSGLVPLHRLTAKSTPPVRMPWYAAGSGIALSGMLLLILPSRRRWGAVLMLVLSVAVLGGAGGCGSGGVSAGGTSGSTGSTTVNATAGTYTLLVTASYTNPNNGAVITHNANVTFVVQ
jgi:Bacterial Ig-like domain (group 3)